MHSMWRIRIASRRRIFGFAVIICLSVFAGTLTPAATNETASPPTDQPKLIYRLTYALETPNLVHIAIHFPQPAAPPLTMIMPRSVPGGYAQRPYDPFVANVRAFSESPPHASKNDDVSVERNELGPRWTIGKRNSSGVTISRIDYDIDVAKMERDILLSSDTSKIR